MKKNIEWMVVFKDYMDIAISIYAMLLHAIFNEIMTIFFVLGALN
jgi:hypothetical protein